MKVETLRHRGSVTVFLATATLIIVTVLVGGGGHPLSAADCTVPGDHATIQDAAGDYGCDPINLADQAYPESVRLERSVTIAGPPQVAEIAGLVAVEGAGTVVHLANVRVDNGCAPESLSAASGGRVAGESLEVVHTDGAPCPSVSIDLLFADGFESGDTSSWTGSVPRPALTTRSDLE